MHAPFCMPMVPMFDMFDEAPTLSFHQPIARHRSQVALKVLQVNGPKSSKSDRSADDDTPSPSLR